MNEKTSSALLLENERLRKELYSLTKAKNDLLIHKQRLDAILENAPLEVYLKDKEGRYVKVNKQFEKNCGVKSNDLVGLLPDNIFSPKLSASSREHDLSVLTSGKTELREQTIEFDIDIQPRKLQTVKFPIFNADGDVHGLGAISTDITANLLTKESLRKSNILFSQAESMGNMGHWSWDLVEDRLIACSTQFALLFSMTVPEALDYFTSSEAVINLVHPDDKEYFKQSKNDPERLTNKVNLEYRIISPSGDTRHLHTRHEFMFNSNGTPSQSFGTAQDITERNQVLSWGKSRTHILELIASDVTLAVITEAIVRVIEEENPALLCSILLVDDFGENLLVSAAPSLPEFYRDAIDGIEISMGAGSCGTAAFINKRVIVEDIQSHPYWTNFKELASKAKLVSCWSEPIFATNGKLLGTFGIYCHKVYSPTNANISALEQAADLASIAIEKKQSESILKFSENRLRLALAVTKQAWFDLNIQTGVALTSSEYAKQLGYNPVNFHGDLQGWEDSLHPDDHDAVMTSFQTCLSHGIEFSSEYRRSKKGGGWLWFNTLGEITEWSSSQQPLRMIGIHTDITERKHTEKKLEHNAHYDLLTNLPNRVLLADRISQAIMQCHRRKQSLAVAFLDLDSFKEVNDTYGHNVGDELLIRLSHRMKEALREGDTLARIGGDEFIAVIVDLDNIEESKPVLERLLMAASEAVTLDDDVMQVSASIGVTLYPQDGVEPDQLMRRADQAMYLAKQGGKNRYHLFDTEHNNAIEIQRAELDDIHSALELNEFFLHYQPKVNMNTSEVMGVEALIRWQHPDRGLIPPLDFLTIIEGHVISLEVGEWVIINALKQLSQWHRMGIRLAISVNISAYQLQQDNFPSRLAILLAVYPDVSPTYLELEILETSELSDISQVFNTMNTCHELGIRFALDDFGTGYSSLTHLRRLPAYLIKIDQSFVLNMLEDAEDLAIVEGVIGLAKTFQREVIAEGVETIAHGEALLKLGCKLAQGYCIARPMPSADIPEWISKWKTYDAWRVPELIVTK